MCGNVAEEKGRQHPRLRHLGCEERFGERESFARRTLRQLIGGGADIGEAVLSALEALDEPLNFSHAVSPKRSRLCGQQPRGQRNAALGSGRPASGCITD